MNDEIKKETQDFKKAVEKAKPDFLTELEEYRLGKTISEETAKTQDEEVSPVASDEEESSTVLEVKDRSKALQKLRFEIDTIQQVGRKVWETGIKQLDEALGGGFLPKQLITLGAITGLGKSTLALQIADHVAAQGKDVIYISLEMDDDELLARSISRETFLLTCDDDVRKRERLTTLDILTGQVGAPNTEKRKLFDEAVTKTQELDRHLKYIIGENNVDVKAISDTVRQYKKSGRSPLVIVDYLQIMQETQDNGAHWKDKRLLTDEQVTTLKTLARDLEVPVVLISAFNRESNLQPVTAGSFKESGGIEYSSDVLLGLQYNGQDFQKHEDKSGALHYESQTEHDNRVRELQDRAGIYPDKLDKSDMIIKLELKVLKARYRPKTKVGLDFHSAYNYFEEFALAAETFKEAPEAPGFDDDSDIVTLD